MEQPNNNFLSFNLDLPYVEVVTHECCQKGIEDYSEDNLYTLRLSGLTTS